MKINQSLLNRLAAKKAGKYVSPLAARPLWSGTPFRRGAYFGRWTETPNDCSDLKGRSDELINIRHTGWYCDDMGHATMFGVVREIKTSRGMRYLACINDPWQGDKNGDGPCVVEVNEDGSPVFYDCEREAARHADAMAERSAELEREHDEAYQEQMAE
jgi:hypothetical protein